MSGQETPIGAVDLPAERVRGGQATIRAMHSRSAERRTWRLLFLIVIMVVTWVVFNHLTGGIYITPRNLSNLSIQTSITALVAIGVGGLLIAREIDLSVGSILGAVVVATVWVQVDHGWSTLPAVLLALAIGGGIGLFQGLCTTALRIPSFIVTLAGFSYLRGVAYGLTGSVTLFGTASAFQWFANGTFSNLVTVLLLVAAALVLALLWLNQRWLHLPKGPKLGAFARSLRPVELVAALAGGATLGVALWTFTSFQGLPAPVAILGAVAIVASFVTRHTAFGRHIYAIGGSPEAARRAGIHVQRVVVVLFVVSGLLAGLGGVIQAALLGSGPPNVGLLLALDAISAAVVGGTSLFGGQGSVAGILVGAFFLSSIQNGLELEGVSTYWQYVVSGLVLLAAVSLDQAVQLWARRGEE